MDLLWVHFGLVSLVPLSPLSILKTKKSDLRMILDRNRRRKIKTKESKEILCHLFHILPPVTVSIFFSSPRRQHDHQISGLLYSFSILLHLNILFDKVDRNIKKKSIPITNEKWKWGNLRYLHFDFDRFFFFSVFRLSLFLFLIAEENSETKKVNKLISILEFLAQFSSISYR